MEVQAKPLSGVLSNLAASITRALKASPDTTRLSSGPVPSYSVRTTPMSERQRAAVVVSRGAGGSAPPKSPGNSSSTSVSSGELHISVRRKSSDSWDSQTRESEASLSSDRKSGLRQRSDSVSLSEDSETSGLFQRRLQAADVFTEADFHSASTSALQATPNPAVTSETRSPALSMEDLAAKPWAREYQTGVDYLRENLGTDYTNEKAGFRFDGARLPSDTQGGLGKSQMASIADYVATKSEDGFSKLMTDLSAIYRAEVSASTDQKANLVNREFASTLSRHTAFFTAVLKVFSDSKVVDRLDPQALDLLRTLGRKAGDMGVPDATFLLVRNVFALRAFGKVMFENKNADQMFPGLSSKTMTTLLQCIANGTDPTKALPKELQAALPGLQPALVKYRKEFQGAVTAMEWCSRSIASPTFRPSSRPSPPPLGMLA